MIPCLLGTYKFAAIYFLHLHRTCQEFKNSQFDLALLLQTVLKELDAAKTIVLFIHAKIKLQIA